MIDYVCSAYNYEAIRILKGGAMATKMSPDQIKDKVQTWLMEDGWSLRQETPSMGLWTFVATDQFGRVIAVGQRKNKEDEVIIQLRTTAIISYGICASGWSKPILNSVALDYL